MNDNPRSCEGAAIRLLQRAVGKPFREATPSTRTPTDPHGRSIENPNDDFREGSIGSDAPAKRQVRAADTKDALRPDEVDALVLHPPPASNSW